MTTITKCLILLLSLYPCLCFGATNLCMRYPSGNPVNCVDSSGGGNAGIGTGGVNGIVNQVPVYSSANTIMPGIITDNGTNVGIGTTINIDSRLKVKSHSNNTALTLQGDILQANISEQLSGGFDPVGNGNNTFYFDIFPQDGNLTDGNIAFSANNNTLSLGSNYLSKLADFGSPASEAFLHLIYPINYVPANAPAFKISIADPNVGTSDVFTVLNTGNVGINTVSPTGFEVEGMNVGIGTPNAHQILEVNGTAKMTGFQLNKSPLAGGNILVSTSVGVGTWMPTSTLNAGTATALAANGTNCTAGNYPLGVDASGNSESCTAVTSSQWATQNTTDVSLSGGNVGIGTTKTTTAALTVMNGNVGIGTWNPTQALVVIGTENATAYIKSGGTSSQFLKADGSIDSSTYLTGNQSITLTGDVTGSGTTSIATTMKGTGSAGTYRSTTFDAQGRETSGTNPTTFSGYGLSDTSANLAAALTDEVGTGFSVFNASPNFTGNVGVGTVGPLGRLIVWGGNVGIGSNVPGQALDVQGTIRATAMIDTGVTASKVVVTDANKQLTAATNLADLAYCQTGGTNCPGSITGFANPSATIGLSANNGAATTAMRSDATPALGVTISPTWTGNHTFAPSSGNTLIISGNVGIGTSTNINGLMTLFGNVGISSSAPGSSLDVFGSVRILNSGTLKISALTASRPALIDSSSQIGTGTYSGNTTTFGTTSGALTNGDFVKIDANGNLVDGGASTGGSNFWINDTGNVGINTSYNVGIGTISQINTLNILGNVGIGTISYSNYLKTSAPSGGAVFEGNVGVGTYSPTNVFQLNGTSGTPFNVTNGSTSEMNLTSAGILTINAQLVTGGSNTQSVINDGLVVNSSAVTSANGGDFQANTNVGIGTFYINATTGNIGIGTTAPQSGFTLGLNTHLGSTGIAPTVASNDCGSTAQGTVNAGSTDLRGTMVVGTLTVTSCAITFNTPFGKAPVCITQDDTNVLGIKNTQTTTKMTVTSTASMSGDNVSWICVE